MKNVHLEPIKQENIEAAFQLNVAEEQHRYVAPIEKSLAYAYVNRDQVQPFGIYAEEQMVGYVLTIYDPSDGMYCVWHMLIDSAQQGQGYGYEGLKLVLDYFRSEPFGKGTSIGLSCHEENTQALQLYRRLGFKETGEKDDENELTMLRDFS
ncbi:GNAT family N-acetyltransferase [Enterococcus sp. LJL128]